ncbi:MAG TPA: hypothetical protein VMJ75_10460 [Candidatus Acidoferrales bacterium]|nr:hypothetical protein [Candidatus Acidoferrales bacterium]
MRYLYAFTTFRCAAVAVLCFVPTTAAQTTVLPEQQALGGAQCGAAGSEGALVHDAIIAGAGLYGLTAAKELQHLGHRAPILERNAETATR